MLRKALAWAVLLLAASVLGAELLAYQDTGDYAALGLDGAWQHLHPGSLIWVEKQVRALAPSVWDPGLVTALKVPVWSVVAVLGLIIYPWRRG
jgi:hypothetical protein